MSLLSLIGSIKIMYLLYVCHMNDIFGITAVSRYYINIKIYY